MHIAANNMFALPCYHFYFTGLFVCLGVSDAEVLAISIQNVSEGGQSYLRVRLQCNSMDLAAELIQDLAKYFKLEELESEADFPAEFREFEEVMPFLSIFHPSCGEHVDVVHV